MNTALTLLVAILMFGLLIFIHELGHYIAARAFGIRVYTFSIGMGPKLVWYDSKKTGIRYQLCMIPFGGYVSMAGEGEDESAESDDPAALVNQPAWRRLIVMAAGGVVNLVAGSLLMLAVVLGTPLGSTVVADFPPAYAVGNSSTADYGLQSGDEILALNGSRIHTSMELDYEVMRKGTEPMEVLVRRDTDGDGIPDTELTLNVSFPTEQVEGQTVGVIDFRLYAKEKNFASVVSETFFRSTCMVRMVWESLFDLFTGRFSFEAVSGPVGITTTVGTAASYGIFPLLYLVAMISINLGVLNLFPLPALDGGRIFFLLIEIIFRKPVPRDIEAKIHAVGLIALLLFSVFITVLDVRALF